MSKKSKSILAVYAIILVAYCVLFFVVPFPKIGACWAEFAFSVVAVMAGGGISLYAFRNEGLTSKIYGFPLFRVGFIYMIVQLVVGIVTAVVSVFAAVPVWIPVVVSVLIMAFAGIGVIGTDNARDIIADQQEKTQSSVRQMKTFRMDMRYIVDICTDPELKKPLEKLADDFRYSDPVTNEELAGIEEDLQAQVKALASLVNSDKELARKKMDEISVLLADRNRRCRELKG